MGLHPLLGEDMWAALLSTGVLRRYRPRDFLLRQGDRGGFLLAVAVGRVMVVRTQEDGSTLMLALRGPGDIVGESAVREAAARTASVQALDPCTAYLIPAAAFERFLANKEIWTAFADYLMIKISEAVPYQFHVAHFPPCQRIARLLFEIFSLAGPEVRDQRRIPLSQEAVGHALGLSRGTVAKHVAALRSAGALAPGPRLAVADPDVLRQAAGIGPRMSSS